MAFHAQLAAVGPVGRQDLGHLHVPPTSGFFAPQSEANSAWPPVSSPRSIPPLEHRDSAKGPSPTRVLRRAKRFSVAPLHGDTELMDDSY